MTRLYLCVLVVLSATIASVQNAAMEDLDQANFEHRQARATLNSELATTVFETDTVPTHTNGSVDYRYLPYVGNGHIAHVVYTDTLHVNGLYSGKEGGSHRARVPMLNAIRITMADANDENVAKRTHKLDVAKGVWMEEILVDRVCKVTMYVYAHQVYSRVMVTQVRFNREKTEDGQYSKKGVTLNVNEIPAARHESDDLRISSTVEYGSLNWKRVAVTKIQEFTGQPSTNVYQYYNDIPDTITINQHSTSEEWQTYIMSVDTNDAAAKKDFDDAEATIHSGAADSKKMFLQNHTQTWANTWSRGRVDVDNAEISDVAYTSMYYLMSSLPTLDDPNGARGVFYGVSPDGLANGGQGSDFQGHVLPDMEIQMFPPILMFHPTIAKEMLSYRYHTMGVAKTAAKDLGFAGTKYSYESGRSGRELATNELHTKRDYVTGDVAFAARQYLLASRDTKWLNEEGRELMHNAADFWQSRAIYDGRLGAYGIDDVYSPDTFPQSPVDNSVYTNAGASQAIWYSDYANCLSGESDNPSEWKEKANKMAEMFDVNELYHPAYEGYQKETTVNEADAILLGYPLQWQMLPDVRANDLNVYSEATSGTASHTTSAMFAIGFLEIGETTKAANAFRNTYSNTLDPFHVWTNSSFGADAVNYVSGAGAFLQTLLFGYGGFRLNHEQLDFDPVLPSLSSYMQFSGLEFLESEFDFRYDSANILINVTKVGNFPLAVSSASGASFSFRAGESITIPRTNGTISTTQTQCSLPMNREGGLVGSSAKTVVHPVFFIFVTLVALFCSKT